MLENHHVVNHSRKEQEDKEEEVILQGIVTPHPMWSRKLTYLPDKKSQLFISVIAYAA